MAGHYLIGVSIAGLLLHTFCLMGLIVPVAVSGSSMLPTLREGQRLIVDRTAFLVRGPRHGELVVFRCPDRANEFCVKRVFGLPGDRVVLEGGKLHLNPPTERANTGNKITQPTSASADKLPDDFDWVRQTLSTNPITWEMSDHKYFVVGDNRAISEDSRNWVPSAGLDAKLLVGKPIGVR
jgi:signal peptidase I